MIAAGLLFLLKWFLLGVGCIVLICIVLTCAILWFGRMDEQSMQEFRDAVARKNHRP